MKKGFVGIFVLFGIAFMAITFLKQETESNSDSAAEARSAPKDSTRTEVIDFWNYYDRATDLRTARAYEEAIPIYRKALSIDPEHHNSLYYLGNLLLRTGKYSKAESSWKQLARVNPSSARAYSQLGTLYSCNDSSNPLYDLDKAAEHFFEAARLNREETGPLLQLAKIDLVNGDFESSGKKLGDVITSNFRSAEALFLKGYLEWKKGSVAEAETLLERAVSIVKGTSTEKNVGEGDTKDGTAGMLANSFGCSLYSDAVTRHLQSAIPDKDGPMAEVIYRTFEKEFD